LKIGSLESAIIVIGFLESEKSGPYRVPNIFLKKKTWNHCLFLEIIVVLLNLWNCGYIHFFRLFEKFICK